MKIRHKMLFPETEIMLPLNLRALKDDIQMRPRQKLCRYINKKFS